MGTDTIILFLIMHAIISAGLAANLAKNKGYSPLEWGTCGFFFGLLGLIAAAGLPSRITAINRDIQLTKACSACMEDIAIEATRCKYCGEQHSTTDLVASILSIVDNDNDTANAAVNSLKKIGGDDAISALSNIAGSGHHSASVEAAKALLTINTPKSAVATLRANLRLMQAKHRLLEIGDKSVSKDLLEILELPGITRSVATIEILAKIKDPDTVIPICTFAEKESTGNKLVLISAIKALGAFSDPAAVPTLADFYLHNRGLSSEAGNSIIRIGPSAVPILEELQQTASGKDNKKLQSLIANIRSAQKPTTQDE